MLAQQIAQKYATALFRIVREKNLIEKAHEQFEALDKLLEREETFLQFLTAPHILEQDKEAFIRNVLGSRIEPLLLEFILFLMRKSRIGYLHQIIEQFQALVTEERGIVVAEVTSVIPLTPAERASLVERLSVKTEKKINLEEKVDPAILGGMKVMLKDEIIDGSIKHQLLLLKEELGKLKVA